MQPMTGNAHLPRWVCAVARINAAERRFERWFQENMWEIPMAMIVFGVPVLSLVLGNGLSVAILLHLVPQQGYAGLIVLGSTVAMDLFVGYVAVWFLAESRYGDDLEAACAKRGEGA